MSLQSMTGFGRAEKSTDTYSVTVEIKSVNHRFRDIRFKMSPLFNSCEVDFRNLLASKFFRGSFDIYINYKKTEKLGRLEDLDEEKILGFLEKMERISDKSDIDLEFSPTEFLRSEFFKDTNPEEEQELQNLARETLTAACMELSKSREVEGKKLVSTIKEYQDKYATFYKKIMIKADTFQEQVKDNLLKKFKEFSAEIPSDEPRFMQEIIYYLEKLDVHEELDRIGVHLEKLTDLLQQKREVGRKIDFLMQELNRETNTIGSKSNDKDISNSVVQMKMQLEKIREQNLNLE